MKFRNVAIKLTLFAVFTGTVTVMLASTIGNFTFFRARYPISAVFDDVTGILNSDPVTLGGVTVGKVTGARVEKGLAVVELSIDRSLKLPRSTRVEIRYRNLIGLRVVNLDPGEGSGPYLREGDRVPLEQTQGPLDLDKVFNNLRPILTGFDAADINTLSEALVESFAKHKDDIDAVLADTATFLGSIAPRGDKIGNLISNLGTLATAVAAERNKLDSFLANFATVAETLAGDSGKLDRTLVNLDTATREIGRLIADNRPSIERDLDDLVTVLNLVLAHQQDLEQIAGHLDDVLASTLRAMSYGEWGNLYVPALCTTITPGCNNGAASAEQTPAGVDALYRGVLEGIS